MQIKKSPKADLNNKKGLFLEIGLIFALLLTIAAFAYTQKERNVEIIEASMEVVEEEITDITTQDQKPPEPPKKVEMQVLSDVLNVVTNDTKIDTEFDFSEFSEDIEIVQNIEVVEEALCFGWIDSTVKCLPDGGLAQRLSPRRKGSHWTDLNKQRCNDLEHRGLMTESGRRALERAK